MASNLPSAAEAFATNHSSTQVVASSTINDLSDSANKGSALLLSHASRHRPDGLDPIMRPTAAKSAAYTIVAADEFLTADATSAAFQITLPNTSAVIVGQEFTIKRINSGSNNVTVGTTASQTIDGAATVVLTAQWQVTTVKRVGSNWLVSR